MMHKNRPEAVCFRGVAQLDHLTDIAHIGIQGPAEDGQDQLKHLIHDVILLSVRWRRVLY